MKLFSGIINLGKSYVDSEAELFRLRMFNISCLAGILLCMVSIIIYFIYQIEYSVLLINTSFFIFFLSGMLYLHSKGRFLLTGILTNIVIYIAVVFGYLYSDSAIHVETQFIVYSLLSFFIIYKNKRLILAFFATFVLSYLITSSYDLHLGMKLPPDTLIATKLITNIVNTFAFMLFGLIGYRYNQIRIKELSEHRQQLMEAKKALEQSNLLKSAFLANMSHEIRTPMNGILGFSKLLTESSLPKEQATYANIVHEGSKQLLAVVDDVLDFSKIETGQVTVYEDQLDIQKLFKSLNLLFGKTIKDKGLESNYTLPVQHQNLNILTDRQKVRQILTNLFSNAIKFTEEGHVNLHVSISNDQKYIQFAVKDTGIGIAKNNKQKIFERFQQVKFAKGQMIEGTGLGLTISKNYAELLGGSMTLESTLGVGSTFVLSIPYQPAPVNEQSLGEHVSQSTKQVDRACTILLAEDIMFNTLLVQKLLKGSEVQLHCVQDGKAAVDFIEEHPEVDIVLMDIMMPIMDGRTAMQHIKNMQPELPVIALTAFGMNDEKTELLEEGFDFFVSKPLKRETFLRAINTALQSSDPRRFSGRSI